MGSRAKRTVGAFGVGMLVAYLLDPQSGKGRRHQVRDRTRRLLRRGGRRVVGKARYTAGQMEGVAAEARSAVFAHEVDASDETVKSRILSQAFRDAGVSTGDVDVDVLDGIATLHGTLASIDLAHDLIERVRAVPGVRTVTPRLSVSAGDSH